MKQLFLLPYFFTSLVVCTVYAFKYASLLFAWWYVITLNCLAVAVLAQETSRVNGCRGLNQAASRECVEALKALLQTCRYDKQSERMGTYKRAEKALRDAEQTT